jgi:ADP-ribose pyrophosphatase YjhB (NUDIX family)
MKNLTSAVPLRGNITVPHKPGICSNNLYRKKILEPKWLEWAKKIQAIAQIGLTYSQSIFDTERYQELREISTEIMAIQLQLEQSDILDLFSREIGYATPKVDVRASVFRDNQILLVKEKSDGCWALPGGWADVSSSPSESAVREVFEESGYYTRPVKLVAVYDLNKQGHPPHLFHIYKLFFQCEIIGGEATPSIETSDVGFFSEDNIPPLSLGRVMPHQITRLFEHYRQPELPTDFD